MRLEIERNNGRYIKSIYDNSGDNSNELDFNSRFGGLDSPFTLLIFGTVFSGMAAWAIIILSIIVLLYIVYVIYQKVNSVTNIDSYYVLGTTDV